MNSEQPVLDVELIVTDLHGPHAFGITTEDGRRYLVVDKAFPRNDWRARAAFFCTYQKLTGVTTTP